MTLTKGDMLKDPNDPKPVRVREVKGDMVTLDLWEEPNEPVAGSGRWKRMNVSQLSESGWVKLPASGAEGGK